MTSTEGWPRRRPEAVHAGARDEMGRERRERWLWLALALLLAPLVGAAWMASTGRHSFAQLSVPVNYSGDGLGVLALLKAYASGDISPLVIKQVPHLGAPFGANWTDYPVE